MGVRVRVAVAVGGFGVFVRVGVRLGVRVGVRVGVRTGVFVFVRVGVGRGVEVGHGLQQRMFPPQNVPVQPQGQLLAQ